MKHIHLQILVLPKISKASCTPSLSWTFNHRSKQLKYVGSPNHELLHSLNRKYASKCYWNRSKALLLWFHYCWWFVIPIFIEINMVHLFVVCSNFVSFIFLSQLLNNQKFFQNPIVYLLELPHQPSRGEKSMLTQIGVNIHRKYANPETKPTWNIAIKSQAQCRRSK